MEKVPVVVHIKKIPCGCAVMYAPVLIWYGAKVVWAIFIPTPADRPFIENDLLGALAYQIKVKRQN